MNAGRWPALVSISMAPGNRAPSRRDSVSKDKVVVVAGAGGFIGGHLTADLLSQGYRVRAADIKPLDEWYQVNRKAENFAGPMAGDLRAYENCRRVCKGASEVYQLAADMGGMGF